MSDIVDEEVELHLIDTKQLAKEAEKLKEAKKIKKDFDKLKGKKKKPLTNRQMDKADERRDKQLTKKEKKSEKEKKSKVQKQIKEIKKKQKKALKKIDQFQDKFVSELNSAKNMLSPVDAVQGIGIIHNSLGRFGPIGAAVAAIAGAMAFELIKQYERGGIFATPLKITEKEKNTVDIDYVIDVRSGTKYLTSDLRVVQKAPETSNTLNLQYEHVRYVSQELGR